MNHKIIEIDDNLNKARKLLLDVMIAEKIDLNKSETIYTYVASASCSLLELVNYLKSDDFTFRNTKDTRDNSSKVSNA